MKYLKFKPTFKPKFTVVQKQLQAFIQTENIFNQGSKLLLALSGGVDSVVLLQLLTEAEYTVAVAHVNFNLRGAVSNQDQQFVEDLAKQYRVAFYTTNFDTAAYAKQNKVSIQMAARDLRYTWFEEIRIVNGFDFIATAHHQDDNLETILLNLTKGTGLKGLRGILPKNGKIVRPLLPFSKEQIIEYATANQLKWREDASNQSVKYERNKIRLEVIPVLKNINPQLLHNLQKNTRYLRETEHIYKDGLQYHFKRWVQQKGAEIYLPILKIKKTKGYATILYEYLKDFGYNADQVSQIIDSFNSEPGKQFLSPTHQLIKDRKFLILAKQSNPNKTLHLIDIKQEKVVLPNLEITIKVDRFTKEFDQESFKNYLPTNEQQAKLHYNKLAFPLRLRRWQKGDFFYPFGMKRKKKKLSDFFTDHKLSKIEKEKVWILEDDKKRIVWVVGFRIDDRFGIHKKIKKVLHMINTTH